MDKFPNVAGSRQSLTDSSKRAEIAEATRLEATAYAKVLLGCYRTGEANDPEVYVRAIVAVLSEYPVGVMARVCSPLSGLPSRLSWLPTVAEVTKACEELHGPMRRMQEWDAGAARQLAARERLEKLKSAPNRKTYEQIKAECAEVGIFIGGKPAGQTTVDAAQIREKHGISQAQWDAIPNAPPQRHT